MKKDEFLRRLKQEWLSKNPFIYNYVFSKEDLKRPKLQVNFFIKFLLKFLRTYIQLEDGYLFYYKQWKNNYYLIKVEKFIKEENYEY